MNNILLDELPTDYNGIPVNTSFRIGIQIALLQEDTDVPDNIKGQLFMELLFGDDDGNIGYIPENADDIVTIIEWFMAGWFHDRVVKDEDTKRRLMDYDIDQFRIYADFMAVYGIDLNTVDMHWWAFQGLLWNLPYEKSSFMQAIEIRTKKPRKGASLEEKEAIKKGHQRYDLSERKEEIVFTREEETKIDEFDAMMAKAQKKKAEKEAAERDILKQFSNQ